MKLFSSEKEKYLKYVKNFRKKTIPKNFNQIKLMDYLLDEDIDHYISISNRSDGKTFNYIHFAFNLAIDYGVNFMLLSRSYMVRGSYITLIEKIAKESQFINENELAFGTTQFYKTVIYKGEIIGVITDLNEATNLKYFSNFLSDYPFIIYDEFLAIEGDYLPDEWERLKTIYSSVNRNFNIPLIKIPKILYLGNAVNFSSPILANLDIYKILENHPIDSVAKYGNICLEMFNNKYVNELRNLRAFDEKKDGLTSASFNINNYGIITSNERKRLLKDYRKVVVKLDNNYLVINYSLKEHLINLAIVAFSDNYDFNVNQSDNKKSSIFLKDSFYSDTYYKKYQKNIFLFENAFSKDYILSNNILKSIKILKLIGIKEQTEKSEEEKLDQYQDNYIKDTKKAILKKFLG